MSWPVSFDRPEWLWLLLAIPVIALASWRSLRGLDRHQRIVELALRSLVIVLLALALAHIQYVKKNDHIAVMFVVDKSHSVPESLREEVEAYIRQTAEQADPEDRVGIIGFDGRADVDLIPSRGGATAFGFSMAVQPDRTDVAGGVRLALATFPAGYARRIVILTDGNQNAGDLTQEIATAVANNVAVDVVPLTYEHADEILFDRIDVPTHASPDTKIPVRLIVRSRRATPARITLEHTEPGRRSRPVPLTQEIWNLAGDMRPTVIRTETEVFGGGVHRFHARVTPIPADADAIPENNQATAFTFVEAEGRVLILCQPDPDGAETGSHDDDILKEVLTNENIDVVKLGVDRAPVDLTWLQQYSVVILANVSADSFNREVHQAIASYVKDFGGGLIMTGGDESFGAGGWIGSPVEEISPVSFEVKHRKVMPRGALAIVLHSCELPKAEYWGEQIAIAAVKTISSLDYVGILCYDGMKGGVNWDVPMGLATDKAAIVRKIKQMQVGDMPDFDTAMQMGTTGLLKCWDASQRHMIIISDGDPSPPSKQTIQRMITNKITCSTVGIGYGGGMGHVKEKPLQYIALATTRDPRKFHPCKDPKLLPQIMIKEAKVVKRPLIDEQKFTPLLRPPADRTMLGIRQEELPPLGGLVLTESKPDIDVEMPLCRTNSEGGKDPVFAHWHYRMGKMAVFTSGWWPKWGSAWAGWEKFGKFWAQAVRWTMRQTSSADFDVMTRIEGNQGKVVIEALDKDASFLNFLQIQGRLKPPSMESRPLRLTQTGPGRYEATFDANDNGNYLVSLSYTKPDPLPGPDGEKKPETVLIRTGATVPYSPEFRELDANEPLLQEVLQHAGGRRLAMDPQQDEVFSREGLPPSLSRQPVWPWVVQWLLLPLFLLDVAARRLASAIAMSLYAELAVFAVLFGILYAAEASVWAYVGALVLAELVGWTVRWRSILPTIQFFTATVTALSRAGQRSAASLSQLKGVREKVREDLHGKPAQEKESETIPLEPIADKRARFDVGDEDAAEPAGDLTKQRGGAEAAPETPKPTKPKTGAKTDQPGDLTSRLLKAKRRARDEIEDREKNE